MYESLILFKKLIGVNITLKYKYLIIGGGIAAANAANAIVEKDPKASIGIISKEKYLPYSRPSISKGLWKDEKLEDIDLDLDSKNIKVHLGLIAEKIDPKNKIVIDKKGEQYKYEKLLIATGGNPNRLPWGGDNVIYFRDLSDYKKLRELTEDYDNFGIIGGGFIGSEIAAALCLNRKKVTMIFPEVGIGGLVFPKKLSEHLNEYYEDRGVEILSGKLAKGIEKKGKKIILKTEGKDYEFDAIIAGIGIKPATELAEMAGLKVDNGIVVNEYLQTSDPDIYAAGDVTNFYNPALDKRIRVEHEDNANVQGETAGYNMAGAKIKYEHLPFFYSDLFDLGYEAVGELSAKFDTFVDWQEEFEEGVVYYLKDGVVQGVLLWNVWEQVENAAKIIAEKRKTTPEELKGKLPLELTVEQ